MKIRDMVFVDIKGVAKLFLGLINHIKEETNDDYFKFENLSEEIFTKELKSILTDPLRKIFVAEENEQVIGFISGTIKGNFLKISQITKIGYIDGAFVLDKFRGKGLIKDLEEILSDYFKTNNVEFIELNVLSKNELGKNAWKNLGYSTFREQMRKRI